MSDEISPPERRIAPGIYRHYKGKNYFVLGISRDSETDRICVVYRPLYDSDWMQLWHRPLDMFLEDVTVDGRVMPRFERIGE
jgi:hypothetical protein